MMKKWIVTGLMLIGIVQFAQSQQPQYCQLNGQDCSNAITTAVPFLMIAPDARGGAMGDAGVSSIPGANSMHWNPAKYAFIESNSGVSLSYSPWMRSLVNDINLAYLSFYTRLDELSTIAFTLRYFSLGEIQFTNQDGSNAGLFSPNEFAIDGTYARKLGDNFSGAVAGRFIYSNLTAGQVVQGQGTTAGISVAADVAIYWQKDVNWFKTMDAQFAWGLNISNIGNKITYAESDIEKNFIPTNFRVGPRLSLNLDEYNQLSFMLDINKLLVPTPPIYGIDSTLVPPQTEIIAGRDPDVSVPLGMIQSWYDAPNGFSEEMREFSFGFGTEYWYDQLFALRAGFFYEDKSKGNRKYVTLGAGLRYNVFGLDLSYLIPVQQRNPLENTLRFTLTFNFDELN